MSEFITALPMYDFPEARAQTDHCWARLRDRLRSAGIDAPQALTRGTDNLHALWRHPKLLFAQTCWGPMDEGLEVHVHVVGQPDYSAYEGGDGELYSSAIVVRREKLPPSGLPEGDVQTPADGSALLPLDLMRGLRFAYNGADSMSGVLALSRDLAVAGEALDIFAERIVTGSHRLSANAVARGRADICALDCRSWELIRRHEPKARGLGCVGWTKRRMGLPYICSRRMPEETVAIVRATVAAHLRG